MSKHNSKSSKKQNLTGVLEGQGEDIGGIISLKGDDIVVSGTAQDLGERDQVDAEGERAIASVGLESIVTEQQGNKSDVRVVHGLKRNTIIRAVEVGICDQLLDGFKDLFVVVFLLLL